ncbi:MULTISPECIES: hypothetical protein [unclassified Paraburkholderia]|uniref:hypothetical protein n=1 Tax=unclassified Paraburkholderia TaxID=2615204 RepID=UPI002AB1CD07|nr:MULTISPECIES: hypothetical protein [unclassified Paraburkholderia]
MNTTDVKDDPEEERLRQSLFPDLTIAQFRDLLRRQRLHFSHLPEQEQQRIRALIERLVKK